MSAISIVSESEVSRTMHGISASPASIAARIPPLARDDLEPAAARPNQDRLEHALLTHATRSAPYRSPTCWRGWLRVRLDVLDRHHAGRRGSPPGRPS